MNQIAPAATLRDTWNATDPTEPLPSGDPRYVDCTEVRGDEDVAAQMADAILWSERPVHQLFTGHRGCGKSTELFRLKHRLEEANHAVVYFAANDDLDLNDVEYTDVLIAVAKQVHTWLEEVGVTLDPGLLEGVLLWLADVVYETTDEQALEGMLGVDFGAGVSTVFAKLWATITGQIKTSRAQKKLIRTRLDPQISHLIENINLVLDAGRAQVRRMGKQDLVIIVDNLDRVTLVEREGGRTSHEAIYIDHGEQLRALDCHIVFTVPISMLYSPKAAMVTNVFCDYAILPMIKVQEIDGRACEEGLEKLRTILGRRIHLEQVFEDAAVDYLCRACGGHVRDLMRLVRYSCHYAQQRREKPIDLAAVTRAEDRTVNEYGRLIPEKHFPLLVKVNQTKAIENDAHHQLMLHNLSVLEYLDNGNRWHDVHPAAQKLPKFQEALSSE